MAAVQIATGLRERKKKQRRRAIVEAAWDLFRDKGYDATTVDEIAERAQIARRTFFRYFPTKEAVVFYESPERLALFRSLLAQGGRGFAAVSSACLGIARHYSERRDEVVEQYRLIESSPALVMREAEIDRDWITAIEQTLAQRGSAESRRRDRILAGAVFGAVRATLSEWLADDGRADLEGLGNQALSIFHGEAT